MLSSASDIILIHSKWNKSVHAFPKGISQKDNVIVPQEFKLEGLLNGKGILLEEQQWYNFNPWQGNEQFHALHKGIN